MKQLTHALRNEKGVAVPMVAVTLLVLLGFTGLGVDVGRLGLVADEVQNAADIAATAAARQLFQPSPDDPTATPRDHAINLLGQNKVGNTTLNGSHLTILETGNYSDEGEFVADLTPINAVRAQVQFTVDNIVVGALGNPTSVVTRDAIAAFSPTGGAVPTIPIAVGDCLLSESCSSTSCDVALTQVPNPTNSSAWTGFSVTSSVTSIAQFFPEECGGDPSSVPTIKVHDEINLLNGQSVPLLRKVDCMLENDLTEVVLPVVSCGGSLNQAREVLGFARFEILAVRTNGGNKGIDVRALTSASDGPGGGEADFGAGTITMVR